MLGKDLENFSKKMEYWHNKIYPPLTILRTAPCMILSAVALLALQQGASIIRTHDVRETQDVIKVWHAYCQYGVE